MPAPARFRTHEGLVAWLEQAGIAHAARFNLEAVGAVAPDWLRLHLRSAGKRRRLTDVGSAEAVARSKDWLDRDALTEVLPELVLAFLERERSDAEAARSEVPARLEPPAEPLAAALHAALTSLRASFPAAVAPRRASELRGDGFRFDAALPGFRFEDARAFEPYVVSPRGFVLPVAECVVEDGSARVRCTCGGERCVHALAAVDGALLWLAQPPSAALEKKLEELSRPGWQRTILALERALDAAPEGAGGVEVAWVLAVEDDGTIEVLPRVTKLGPKGKRSDAPHPLGGARLLKEHRAALSPADLRVAVLLPEYGGPATRPLLEALVDHPRVVAGDPERPVRVERVPVGVVAEDRGGVVRVSAGVDGTALSRELTARLAGADPADIPFLWDGGCLSLLDAKPELRSLLEILARDGNVFPPASQPALLDVLSKFAERLPVVMPRSVLGESVPARLAPVLRLHAESTGAVEVELRVRPVERGPALVPGHGARDVHVRRGDTPLHAVRDPKREEERFLALVKELGLEAAAVDDRPFAFRFEDGARVFDLLAACEVRSEPPEVEWVGPPLTKGESVGPRALRVSLERNNEWFGALGGLHVGGERVELARLLDAVRRRDRYVRVLSHSYVELTELLREHLEKLACHVHPGARGLAVGPSAVPLLTAMETAGAALDADAGFRALAGRIAKARALAPEVPEGLHAVLRPYQRQGFEWLARLSAWGAGGILADDMGLGKTLQALALLLHRRSVGPALVVAPTSVVFNWREEAARFAPSLRVAVYGETDDRDATLKGLAPGDVLLVSYGLLVRDAPRLAELAFATAVFDEAQNVKNAATQRCRAARAIPADVKFALSGTPIENHTGELWSLFSLVFPSLLGSWEAFRVRYAVPIEKQLEPGAVTELGRVLAPFLLRRTKHEVAAELPPRTDVRVPVVLSSAEWQLYEDARLAALSELHTPKKKLREQQRRVQVLAALTRLRLAASHPRLYDPRSELPSSKLERLLELVGELELEGQRALVFSQFTTHLALVRAALEARGTPYVYLDGETSAAARGDRVKEFQEGSAPLFLISLKAGGFGLNLTAATNVIHLDPWWNPAVEDQASDRAHRIGQTEPVTVYRLVSLGTIEERMLTLHEHKRALVAEILAGKDVAAGVPTEELMGLLGDPFPRVAGTHSI